MRLNCERKVAISIRLCIGMIPLRIFKYVIFPQFVLNILNFCEIRRFSITFALTLMFNFWDKDGQCVYIVINSLNKLKRNICTVLFNRTTRF
jgi:hypothetical protein